MRKPDFDKRVQAAGQRLGKLSSIEALGTNLNTSPRITAKQLETLRNALGLEAKLQAIGGELYACVESISAHKAFRWLTERNGENRDPSRGQYLGIQQDIEAGNWLLTHQGVAFDGEGQLVDGQHRLFAILEADRPVLSVIMVNISRDAVPVMDRHRARRARDLLEFAGSRMTSFQESVIRRGMLGLKGGSSVVTIPQIMGFLELYQADLEWAVAQFPKRISGVVVSPLVAAVFRAKVNASSEEVLHLEKFCEVMNTSVAESAEERAAILLRDWLITPNRSTRKSASGISVYGRCSRAIRAFLDREPLTRLYSSTAELFPLPTQAENF